MKKQQKIETQFLVKFGFPNLSWVNPLPKQIQDLRRIEDQLQARCKLLFFFFLGCASDVQVGGNRGKNTERAADPAFALDEIESPSFIDYWFNIPNCDIPYKNPYI